MASAHTIAELSSETVDKVAKEIDKYPEPRAAVKSALRYAQAEHGWVSDSVVRAVAQLLNLEPIEVYEVATFYDMFYTEPVGRHQLRVCTNISCMLRGAGDIMEFLQNKLDVEVGGMTADGRFTLFEAECLGACGGAPMLVCGDRYFEDLTEEKLDQLLAEMD